MSSHSPSDLVPLLVHSMNPLVDNPLIDASLPWKFEKRTSVDCCPHCKTGIKGRMEMKRHLLKGNCIPRLPTSALGFVARMKTVSEISSDEIAIKKELSGKPLLCMPLDSKVSGSVTRKEPATLEGFVQNIAASLVKVTIPLLRLVTDTKIAYTPNGVSPSLHSCPFCRTLLAETKWIISHRCTDGQSRSVERLFSMVPKSRNTRVPCPLCTTHTACSLLGLQVHLTLEHDEDYTIHEQMENGDAPSPLRQLLEESNDQENMPGPSTENTEHIRIRIVKDPLTKQISVASSASNPPSRKNSSAQAEPEDSSGKGGAANVEEEQEEEEMQVDAEPNTSTASEVNGVTEQAAAMEISERENEPPSPDQVAVPFIPKEMSLLECYQQPPSSSYLPKEEFFRLCRICMTVMPMDNDSHKKHMEAHTAEERQLKSCLECSLMISQQEWKTHLQQHHKSNILCVPCMKGFVDDTQYYLHLVQAHSIDLIHYCTRCNLATKSVGKLREHISSQDCLNICLAHASSKYPFAGVIGECLLSFERGFASGGEFVVQGLRAYYQKPKICCTTLPDCEKRGLFLPREEDLNDLAPGERKDLVRYWRVSCPTDLFTLPFHRYSTHNKKPYHKMFKPSEKNIRELKEQVEEVRNGRNGISGIASLASYMYGDKSSPAPPTQATSVVPHPLPPTTSSTSELSVEASAANGIPHSALRAAMISPNAPTALATAASTTVPEAAATAATAAAPSLKRPSPPVSAAAPQAKKAKLSEQDNHEIEEKRRRVRKINWDTKRLYTENFCKRGAEFAYSLSQKLAARQMVPHGVQLTRCLFCHSNSGYFAPGNLRDQWIRDFVKSNSKGDFDLDNGYINLIKQRSIKSRVCARHFDPSDIDKSGRLQSFAHPKFLIRNCAVCETDIFETGIEMPIYFEDQLKALAEVPGCKRSRVQIREKCSKEVQFACPTCVILATELHPDTLTAEARTAIEKAIEAAAVPRKSKKQSAAAASISSNSTTPSREASITRAMLADAPSNSPTPAVPPVQQLQPQSHQQRPTAAIPQPSTLPQQQQSMPAAFPVMQPPLQPQNRLPTQAQPQGVYPMPPNQQPVNPVLRQQQAQQYQLFLNEKVREQRITQAQADNMMLQMQTRMRQEMQQAMPPMPQLATQQQMQQAQAAAQMQQRTSAIQQMQQQVQQLHPQQSIQQQQIEQLAQQRQQVGPLNALQMMEQQSALLQQQQHAARMQNQQPQPSRVAATPVQQQLPAGLLQPTPEQLKNFILHQHQQRMQRPPTPQQRTAVVPPVAAPAAPSSTASALSGSYDHNKWVEVYVKKEFFCRLCVPQLKPAKTERVRPESNNVDQILDDLGIKEGTMRRAILRLHWHEDPRGAWMCKEHVTGEKDPNKSGDECCGNYCLAEERKFHGTKLRYFCQECFELIEGSELDVLKHMKGHRIEMPSDFRLNCPMKGDSASICAHVLHSIDEYRRHLHEFHGGYLRSECFADGSLGHKCGLRFKTQDARTFHIERVTAQRKNLGLHDADAVCCPLCGSIDLWEGEIDGVKVNHFTMHALEWNTMCRYDFEETRRGLDAESHFFDNHFDHSDYIRCKACDFRPDGQMKTMDHADTHLLVGLSRTKHAQAAIRSDDNSRALLGLGKLK